MTRKKRVINLLNCDQYGKFISVESPPTHSTSGRKNEILTFYTWSPKLFILVYKKDPFFDHWLFISP